MEDIVVEVITMRDKIRFFFADYGEASEFVHTGMYAAYNADPDNAVKFCIYQDKKMP